MPLFKEKLVMDSKQKYQIYFDYLKGLRQSGETNMYGATSYLQREFPELRRVEDAKAVLLAWFRSFESDDPPEQCLSDDV